MLVAAGADFATRLDGNPLGSPWGRLATAHRCTETAPFMSGFSQPLTTDTAGWKPMDPTGECSGAIKEALRAKGTLVEYE
jgi:hypothetical protein